ncbi:ABC transporter, permease protein, putative, partial [hydrothermal vent metagenome]
MSIIIFRQWFGNKLYPILFSLCIIVSLGAFLTLDALQQSVDDYISDNQKQIVGGDIVITDNQAWSDKLLTEIKQLDKQNVVFDYQFNAIVYTDNDSLLTRIKAVSLAYPLYGDLILTGNTGQWHTGSVLVEQQVLNTLNVNIGDSIQIGEAQFIIHAEILTEPDRPLTAFGFGARIIMHDSDLAKTKLMGQKSRINYRIEIKTPENSATESAEQVAGQALLVQLNQLTKNTSISVKTAEQSNTSISNLSQNFLVFLKLLVIAVIALSGIGIMSIVKAFVSRQKNTNAIRVALGEKSTSVITSYRILFSVMALISVLLAWLASLLVLYLGKDIFAAILPNNLALNISWISGIKAIVIALILTTLMTHVTLKSIHTIKPVAVLHKHQKQQNLSALPWLWLVCSGLAALVLLYLELGNIKQSLQVFAGLIMIWLAFALLTKALMSLIKWLLDKNIIRQWMVSLALQNIFRKGNQSNLFITALSMTTMILGTITILDHSINQQLIATYPEDAPNFFLLDVQANQQQQLDEMLGESLTYYPVIRARIVSVNGVDAMTLKTKLGRYYNISRVFNLSYANELLITEKLSKSINNQELFADTIDSEPMSILASFADFLQVGLGDEVVFNVQGIKIKTTITSIRARLKRGPSPFFYFIFPPEVMADAPQIRFATAKVADDKRVLMQTQIAKSFPGITTLDGGNIAKKLKTFVDQLKGLVQIFTALSLFAGLLIFATSLVATSQDRLRESFYYRMMGMQAKDLLQLSIIEFLALGLFAFNLGVLISVIISALITKYWFSLSYIFPWQIFTIAS